MSISIPSELYENNDPEYQGLIARLQILVEQRQVRQYINLLKQIVYSYMFSRKKWIAIFEFMRQCGVFWSDFYFFEQQAIFQLFYATKDDNIILFGKSNYGPKLLSVKRNFTIRKWGNQNPLLEDGILGLDMDLLANDLTFPHCDLDKIFSYYEKEICKSPPKEIIQAYKKSKALYNTLSQLNVDDNEWLNEILKVDDADFVEHNLAYKLSTNLLNRELWEKYLKLLEEKNDMQKILYTFSKYCRVFPADSDLKNRYKTVVQQHSSGVITVPWYNPLEFEKCDTAFFGEKKDDDRHEPLQYRPLTIHYTFENAEHQMFRDSFRYNLINYLQKSANINIRLKLALSCKYFGLKLPFICYKMSVMNYFHRRDKICHFYQQSILINNYDIDELDFFKNIYVTTVLNIQSKHKMFLSKLIKRMISCTVKYLTIVNQDITIDELKFLTQHGNVEELVFQGTTVKHSNGNDACLEEILEMVPKLKFYQWVFAKYSILQIFVKKLDRNIFRGREFKTSLQTLSKLMEIPFENKLKLFAIPCTDIDHFTSEMFLEFLKKKAATQSATSITFPMANEDDERTKEFRDAVLSGIQLSWKESQKPVLGLYFL